MRRLKPVLAFALVAALAPSISARSEPMPPCMDEKMREQVRMMALQGVDQAFKNQVTHLFEVWMKDAREQPMRARAGTQAAIKAYIRSRADALSWIPPVCAQAESQK